MPSNDLEDMLAATRSAPRMGVVEKHLETLDEESRALFDGYLEAAFGEDLPVHAMAKVLLRRFAFPCSVQTMTKWLNERKAQRP